MMPAVPGAALASPILLCIVLATKSLPHHDGKAP
jgi:hypothetical protein